MCVCESDVFQSHLEQQSDFSYRDQVVKFCHNYTQNHNIDKKNWLFAVFL